MISELRTIIGRSLIDYRGWCTKRKIVVIESDDWGAIRMPSKSVYNALLKQGLRVDRCLFSRYDSLESVDDLERLFTVLDSVKDRNERGAVFTANCVVANPDFAKIKETNYLQYSYEPVSETYKRYWGKDDVLDFYKDGLRRRIWKPQLHGREHLNVFRWLRALQENDGITRLCFEQSHFSLTPIVSDKIKARFMDSFGNVSEDSLLIEQKIIEEAVMMFKNRYGYVSQSFIAPCYIWRSELEPVLKKNGVLFIQGAWNQQIPIGETPVVVKNKRHYIGERNKNGQIYTVRNVVFEPFLGGGNEVDKALRQIKVAFFWNKPVIISSHRINYVGSLDCKQRDKNLTLLSELLNKIVELYPEAEFLSSDELGNLITKNY